MLVHLVRLLLYATRMMRSEVERAFATRDVRAGAGGAGRDAGGF